MFKRVLNRKAKPCFTLHGIERAVCRQPSLVDSFYMSEYTVGDEIRHTFTNPLIMLFNQQRIDRLGPEAINMWLKSLENNGNNSLSELRSKVKDEDLFKLLKSKYLQSPSELESYLTEINERVDLCNAEIARVLAEEKLTSQELISVSVEPKIE